MKQKVKGRRHFKKIKASYIVATVIILLYALTMLAPLYFVVVNSIKKPIEFYKNPWSIPTTIYLKNYIDAFKIGAGDTSLPQMYINSIILTLSATLISTIATTAIAYALARFKFPGRNLLVAIGIGAMLIPDLGSRTVVYKMYNDLHIIDTWFILIQYTTPFGLMFLMVFSLFQTVAKEYSEAAKIDGASELRILVKIMLPMAWGVIGLMMVMNSIGVWNDFYTPYMYLPSIKTLALGIQELSEEAQAVSNFTVLYAAMIMSITPVLILFICMRNTIISNVAIGGIKG